MVAVAARERERLIAQLDSNTAHSSKLETESEGFRQKTHMALIEIETQMKHIGQAINQDRASEARRVCRMDKNECSDVIYFPELGRVVNGGNGK